MVIGHKHRLWEVFITVSASGPEYSSVFENAGRHFRPRMAADLMYTTSDSDHWYNVFTKPEIDKKRLGEKHIRLVNPSVAELLESFSIAETWLSQFSSHSDWDGGGLHFNFAGHGCEGFGEIVLTDGTFAPSEFMDHCCSISRSVSSPGRLRISAVLDSCHSGEWVTQILARAFNEELELIVPFNLFASCMPDEYCYEDSSLGHGLFTYCLSIKPTVLGSFAANAVQPDNTDGPSLSIAQGEKGCSLLSGGAQNPMTYWNGAGLIEVSGIDVDFRVDEDFTESDLKEEIVKVRELIAVEMSSLNPSLRIGKIKSDKEMRDSVRATLAELKRQ